MSLVPNIHDVLRWSNRSDIAREITRRGYRVSGETLNRWYRNRSEVPAVVRDIVFDLFGITPERAKEPPPWAEALVEEVPATRAGVDELLEELAALRAVLEANGALGAPSGGDPAGGPSPAPPRGRHGR